MQQVRFDIREIFRSPRLALSLQRIWIQFLGLVIGYLGYLFFTYLGFITAGVGLSNGWKKYGLMPCLFSESSNWYSIIIFLLGVLWLVAVYLIASTAVSRATYMVLKKNYFYTWSEATKFALKKAGSILLSPIAIILIVLGFLAGGAVVALLGKIPFVGEFGITIFTFAWYLSSLVVVLLVIIFAVVMLQTPAIIATTNEDAFEAVFQSFSLTWAQPWRLILYEFVSAAMAAIGLLVFAFLSKQAYIVMDRLFSNVMGADFINIAAHGMYLLNVWLIHSIGWVNSILGDFSGMVYFSREFIPLSLPGYQYVASYIFAIWMLIIGGIIFSYGLATFNVGNTLSYIILRKKKDDENLLEQKDPEEEEEEDLTGDETQKDDESAEGESTDAPKES